MLMRKVKLGQKVIDEVPKASSRAVNYVRDHNSVWTKWLQFA